MKKDVFIMIGGFVFSILLMLIFASYFQREGVELYRYVITFVFMLYFLVRGLLSFADVKRKYFVVEKEEDFSSHLIEE
jgi:predicted tellurium resistance membrane protein TerC